MTIPHAGACDMISPTPFTPVFWQLWAVTGKPHLEFFNHYAVDVQGGQEVKSPDTNRGVYGYLSFGELVEGEPWWHPAQYINWDRQIFYPPNDDCDCLRLWLRSGVQGAVDCDPVRAQWVPEFPEQYNSP